MAFRNGETLLRSLYINDVMGGGACICLEKKRRFFSVANNNPVPQFIVLYDAYLVLFVDFHGVVC